MRSGRSGKGKEVRLDEKYRRSPPTAFLGDAHMAFVTAYWDRNDAANWTGVYTPPPH